MGEREDEGGRGRGKEGRKRGREEGQDEREREWNRKNTPRIKIKAHGYLVI